VVRRGALLPGFRQAAVSFLLSGGVEEDANYLILLAS
jgi:hypothetical protein